MSEAKRGDFHGPSSATCAKAGYTVKSGVLHDLVTTAITLANKNPKVNALMDTRIVKVFPIAMANDGTALRAGLRFDEQIKRVAGLNVDVDLAFVLENPQPSSEFLKEAVVTKASVSFLITLDNAIALLVGVHDKSW